MCWWQMKQANELFDPEGPVVDIGRLEVGIWIDNGFFFFFSVMTARMPYLCDKPLISPCMGRLTMFEPINVAADEFKSRYALRDCSANVTV